MNDITTAAPLQALASAAAPAPVRPSTGRPLWQQLLDATPGLGSADARALAALATQRTVAAGESVFRHHSTAHELVLLLEGSVSVGHGDSAAMSPERLLHGPVWLDAASAWVAGSLHALDARALATPVRVAELPRAAVQALLMERPALATSLLSVLAEQVQDLSLRAHELLHKDANGRLAAWLNRHLQGAQTLLHLSERKRDIAAQLGMSPETLSRQMRQLTRLGLIEVHGYQVCVLDRAGLQRLAQT
jgi:CRP/FNR family transcriptional regulator, dissimilatory nitrate respiration regulator